MDSNPTIGQRRRIPWRLIGWGGAAALLSVPFFAMQFPPTGFDWSLGDFIIMGALFAIVGGLIELAVRLSPSLSYRVGFALAVIASFLIVWVNLAVGIIGSEDNPANLLFLGVLGIEAVGALIARFRAAGMVRAMLATAGAQGAIALYVLASGLGSDEPPGMVKLAILIAGFAGMWLVSAWLFARAARSA
jgi:hypothetical protein